jgi:hypothetical protein
MRDLTPEENVVHVVPINDLREHSIDARFPCECLPEEQFVEGGGVVIVHNSWDGREITERAEDAAFGTGRN